MAPPSLDLQPGLNLQLEVWKKFRHPVSFSKEFSQKEFFLIASFGRCKFRLDSDSVGCLLQSAIGGLAKDFNVSQLSDRVFRFSVSCRQVGFFIYQLQHFKSDTFEVFFNLWNNGGAHWEKEFQNFQAEEESSWQSVATKKISYADALKKPKLTGGNSVPVNHQKEWRPWIVLDDPPHTTKGKKSVFDRLGHHSAASRNLIPKKSVFGRLQFDLIRVLL
jgi:hypothetical protein